MYILKGLGFGSVLSAVLEKFNFGGNPVATRSETNQFGGGGTIIRGNQLRFHSVHGKAITLYNDSLLARRDERYFEHSVLFSHRPVSIDEIIAIEITEMNFDFHGPLRIGFTSCNPSVFQNEIVPVGRDLRNVEGIWMKSLQLFPLNVGTTIYFTVDSDGVVLYGVDEQYGGILFKEVNVSQSLWVILEAYGSVQSVKFVKKAMVLVNNNQLETPVHPSPNFGRRTRRVLNNPSLSLSARRNVRLAPLRNIFRQEPSLPSSLLSPDTPAFTTPRDFDQFSPGLCIICTERERNAAFTKCGHLCMCYECAEMFKNQSTSPVRPRTRKKRNLCPICRRPIISVLRVYV